ncbi:MAG TPA: hypothetical protein VGI42_00760 [Chthoniobacterales bacterium]|jgi:hypothetical protein
MSPDKLFDYLEGKLSETERMQLEERLAVDPQLQRELAIAREMHTRAPGSREVIGENDEEEIPSPQSGVLGRRVATAFALLVMLNVIVGILVIVGKGDRRASNDERAKEAAMRQQLAASLRQTAETALPQPILSDDIQLIASPNERDTVANHVVLLAGQSGGSAAKAPRDDKGVTVVVEIPTSREDEFRRALTPLGAPEFSATPTDKTKAVASGQRKIIQVRIAGAPDPPKS